jgi:glycosyltransferase involved in cell wall biosynthesis
MAKELLSIVIPVRNEAAYIERCVESIYAQDFAGHDYEVIAVDGMSSDSTSEKLKTLKSKFPNLKLLENPNKTVSSGVNVGVRNSAGDIIFRMDAHAEYGSDYIRTCLEVMQRTGADNVGGPAIPLAGGRSPRSQAIALAHLSPFALGGGAFRNLKAEGWVPTVWPGCFRREVFRRVGLLDERLTRTEDIEFNSRMVRSGGRIYLSPRIRSYYICRTRLRYLWRQRWRDGIGVVHTVLISRHAPKLRHFVPLLFIGSLAALTVLALLGGGRLREAALWLLAFEALTYVLSCAYFSLRTLTLPRELRSLTRNERISPLAVLLQPMAFATLHFSYGLGSLWGLATLPAVYPEYSKKREFKLD